MALALQREPTAYCSQLMVAGTVLADPERMLARLVRGCIALAFRSLLACPLLHAATALLIPSRGWRAQLHCTGVATRAKCVQIATDATGGGLGRP